mgnify:CR=1 FL=1
MFRGANAISLDAKGRLAMPSRYRDELVSRSSGQLIVTIDAVDPCLCVYPLDEWEIIETKLRALPSLREENRRLQRLLIQLLALARAEGAEPSGLALNDIDVSLTARSVAEDHAPQALRAGVDLHLLLEGREPYLARCDKVLLTEMLSNLVDNAITYTPAGGTITVRCGRRGEAVFVEVSV